VATGAAMTREGLASAEQRLSASARGLQPKPGFCLLIKVTLRMTCAWFSIGIAAATVLLILVVKEFKKFNINI